MTALNIIDLTNAKELDLSAMRALSGRGTHWTLLSTSVSTGNWSSYSRRYSSYVGTVIRDGYLHRRYREGWKRTRTQTEYTTWYKDLMV